MSEHHNKKIKAVPPVPVICIQEINTFWTKNSRGGIGAVKRGYVPEAVLLPETVASRSMVAEGYPFLLQLISCTERSNFDPAIEVLKSYVGADTNTEILNRSSVRVNFSEGILTARYQWKATLGAPGRRVLDKSGMLMPVNHSPLQKAFELQIGQWGRILYNGRHSDWDNGRWSYDKYVVNIGLFIDPQPDVFLSTKPLKTYSKLALLW